MAGVNHQPFKVRIIDQGFKELFPYPLITPPDKPLVYGTPTFRIREVSHLTVPPCVISKNGIDKQAVIFCYASPLSALPWEKRLKQSPCFIGYVVSTL